MLQMSQNIDMSCGFCITSNAAIASEIEIVCECCRILICLVDFETLKIWHGLKNIANVKGIGKWCPYWRIFICCVKSEILKMLHILKVDCKMKLKCVCEMIIK